MRHFVTFFFILSTKIVFTAVLVGQDSMPIWEKILVLCVLTISFGSLYVVIFTKLDFKNTSNNESHVYDESYAIKNLSVVSRSDWGARPPTSRSALKTIPAPYVIISHTDTPTCFHKTRCQQIVHGIQCLHIDVNGWLDIGYSFLVGNDGIIYEARGWDVEGAHTYGFNTKSIGISFIGDFRLNKPIEAALEAAKKLIEYGVEDGKIDKDYRLLGHRQCSSTKSPGDALFNVIKTWDHWSLKT